MLEAVILLPTLVIGTSVPRIESYDKEIHIENRIGNRHRCFLVMHAVQSLKPTYYVLCMYDSLISVGLQNFFMKGFYE